MTSEQGEIARLESVIETMSQEIANRRPILPQDRWAKWLGEEGHGAATLMQAPPGEALAFYRVDPKVNSNRATGPDLIEPIQNGHPGQG